MEKEKKQALTAIMKFFKKKRVYQTAQSAQKELKKRARQNQKRYRMPFKYRGFFERREFDNHPFGKFDYFYKDGTDIAVLYLHGGAFSSQPVSFHWQFAKDIYARSGVSLYVPLFPLAPKFNYKQTYNFILNFYKFLLRTHKKVFVMGDSAGATLALGLGHLAVQENLAPPKAVIALSPVVDITFSNPEIAKFQELDKMISAEGSKYICQKWARGADFKNPLVSPKYIDFKTYPQIYLFYGNLEILCPDLRQFVEIAHKQGGKIFAVEQKNCYHVYPLMPIPKGEDAREMIEDVITAKDISCGVEFKQKN